MPAMMQALVVNASRRMKPQQKPQARNWPVRQALCADRMGMATGMDIDGLFLHASINPVLYA